MAKTKQPTKRKLQRHRASAAEKPKSSIQLKRILVPIDFSEHSKSALRYAVSFAQQFHASLDLIYVVEPTVYPADFSFGQIGFPNVEEELRKKGMEELEELVKAKIGNRVPASSIVRTGKAFYEIDEYARETAVDLIIIATHGHTGVEHILFGSTAEKVVRHAPCPVLVLRKGEKEFVV
ncbi:MAG: universal stress protein [bacterium]